MAQTEEAPGPGVSPEAQAQLEAFREAHEGEPIGNPADKILFEDDKVRIWDMRLEPGEGSDLHRHEHDYYLVMLEGDCIAGICPKSESTPTFAMALPEGGATISIPKGQLEWSVNVGSKTFYELVIELKDT